MIRLLALTTLAGCGPLVAENAPVAPIEVDGVLTFPVPGAEALGAWSLNGHSYRSSDGLIEVYFTSPGVNAGDEEDPILDDALIARLDQATTIAASWYEFTRQPIVDAMSRAALRGAEIQFAGDEDEVHDAGYMALQQLGVPLSLRPARDRIMHNKFAILDDAMVWTGSTNLSENDVMLNNNGSVLIQDPTLASFYAQELGQMVDGGLFGRKKARLDTSQTLSIGVHDVEVHFSPGDPHQVMLEALDTADKAVYFMVFSFTLNDIADKMIALHQSGVEVVGIFDEGQARGRYSVDERLAQAGIPVFLDGNLNARGFAGAKLHHKTLLVDPLSPSSQPTVTLGSTNWSNNGVDYNDENLLVVRGPELPAAYMDEFCRILAVAVPHPDYLGELPDPCSGLLYAVRINEFLPDPVGTDAGKEFVEIVNLGQAPVNLAGWRLGDAMSDSRHVFDDVTLVPGDALVIYDGPGNPGRNQVIASTGVLSLNNNADVLTLRDAEGAVIDTVAYSGSSVGRSWNRDPDFGLEGDFALHPNGGASPGTRADGTAAAKDLILNEVFINPPGSSEAAHEFVELVNVSDRTIPLGGLTLSDDAQVRHVFADGTALEPGQVIVVWGGGERPGDVIASTGGLSLGNSGDSMTLRDAFGAVIDQYVWTSGQVAPDGVSNNREVDADREAGWVAHTAARGADGQTSSPGLRASGAPWGGRVVINELMADPVGTDLGNEWIELVNVDPQFAADLSGWMVGDAVNPARHVFPPGTTLQPGQVIVLFDRGDHQDEVPTALVSSTGTLSLNNTGDLITLTDAAGGQRDAVSYRNAREGVSLNRAIDGDVASALVDHDTIEGALGAASPGVRADGTAFTATP